MRSTEYIVRLRALCPRKNFAFEPSPGGRMVRLIDLDIGHAVMHPDRRRPTWTPKEAWLHVRAAERERGG